MALAAFGARLAVEPVAAAVDVSAVRYDADRQITVVADGEMTVPALKHSTGKTSTNTASQDNRGGADRDSDQTED
jgi:putative ATP-grasp target RiPP